MKGVADSFGNMVPTDNVTGYAPYSIDPATNRMLHGADTTYYANGLTLTANNHLFWYTAEGNLQGVDQFQTALYLYNGQNERTMTVTQGGWDEYVYLNGQPMADIANTGVWTNYIYANGQKIARQVGYVPSNSTTSYYLDDQLGTAQKELDATGTPTWSGWFTPFGQEIIPGPDGRGWANNAIGLQPLDGTDMRFKFTGKERDKETGLDYFGARHGTLDEPRLGRQAGSRTVLVARQSAVAQPIRICRQQSAEQS